MLSRGRIAIIGQGYVGLPLSLAAAKAGWQVSGIEINTTRLEMIQSGKSPIEDISDQEIANLLADFAYVVTSDFSILSQSQIVVVCVPTPLGEFSKPDLSILRDAVTRATSQMMPGALLINESTSFPGTLREFIKPIALKSRGVEDLLLACAPERVDPGSKNWTMQNTPRLVGGLSEAATDVAVNFYSSFCSSVQTVSSPEVAEMAKLLENCFRQVNIALVNDLARLSNMVGVNIWEVVQAAASKPFGFMPFLPSVGVGGHCIPVDPMYLANFATEKGHPLKLIEAAQQINNSQPNWIVQRAKELLSGSIEGKRIHVVGVGYKSGSRDVRESPSIKLILCLKEQGADVSWEDPLVDAVNDIPSGKIREGVDLVVYAQEVNEWNMDKALDLSIPILDCTGSLVKVRGVFTI